MAMTEIHIDEESLKKLQSLRTQANEYAALIGQVRYQQIILQEESDRIGKLIVENARKQDELLNALYKRYGTGSINIETGKMIVETNK